MSNVNYGLVVPFLNEILDYSRGVEFGILYGRMKHEDEVVDMFSLDNQEQIFLLASRMRWKVSEVQEVGDDWFSCRITK